MFLTVANKLVFQNNQLILPSVLVVGNQPASKQTVEIATNSWSSALIAKIIIINIAKGWTKSQCLPA